jgi:hypothetical protein
MRCCALVLTLAAWLTKYGFSRLPATFRRAKFVKTKLLCDSIPPPDPQADLSPVTLLPGMTNRQVLEKRLEQSKNCTSCHAGFKDFGYAFESFDSIGQYRKTEPNGAIIDTSGVVRSTDDINGAFSSWSDVIDRLASSRDVKNCMVSEVFRYAHGRQPDTAEACVVQQLSSAASPSLKELFVSLVTSDAFRFRTVEVN